MELDLAVRRRDSLGASEDKTRDVMKLRQEIDKCKKELRKKEQHMRHSQSHRLSIQSKIKLACNQSPTVASLLKTRSTPGRPRLEEQQPLLLKTIVDLAMFGASAEERRRSEIVRSCRTLTDLHEKLKEHGFEISRSGTYLRLLPRNYTTVESKRHVVTVPVKLSRPEADRHKAHVDQHFCVATIRSLETLASILGPNQVFFLSQDDKARVPIGLTAANKQAPLLMHVQYRVSLPDHDWVIATRHKLIPSVYAGCIIKDNEMGRAEAVTYSGPTYVAIRSGKHSSSTASTHDVDFDKLATLNNFEKIMRDEEGRLKPVVLISCDGGPDENPRYPKVIAHAIDNFIKHDLDAMFVFTNAPGRSAFNRVERRMAPLSRELSGLILPHDSYGTHLDEQGRTKDHDLEKKNFKKAGEVLSEVWTNMVIDGHGVVAEYVEPDNSAETFVPDLPSQQWYSQHVRESQYLLQVVKCDDRACCGHMRSSIRTILSERFVIPPYPILQGSSGLYIPKPEDHDGKTFAPFLLRRSLDIAPIYEDFGKLVYDQYCPSLQKDHHILLERTCQRCALYFCTKKKAKAHENSCHIKQLHSTNNTLEMLHNVRPSRILTRRSNGRSREILCVVRENDDAEWLDETDVDLQQNSVPTNDLQDAYPVIGVEESLANPWSEDTLH
ncbi:uncharacterized protein LOC126879621 [Diabrotica virgifera virgifera]|uniref:C2H2-type domain-containing protein n=1 Tax=Diabrotica virgifera virgifera TaxID=50390 RepID=A0ABM5JLE2_DIAVI|nr:uncharacterized protein LOC126879621 [Diabrotica virgifera virgifera]